MLMQNFGLTSKEYYGMLWFFSSVVSVTKCENLRIGILIKVQTSHYISLHLPKQKHGLKFWSSNCLNYFQYIFLKKSDVSKWCWQNCRLKFFLGFDLLAWTNLFILLGWQHLMLDFHWLFSCPIWHVWSQASNRKAKIGQFWCCLSQIKQSIRATENQSDSRILLLTQLSEK